MCNLEWNTNTSNLTFYNVYSLTIHGIFLFPGFLLINLFLSISYTTGVHSSTHSLSDFMLFSDSMLLKAKTQSNNFPDDRNPANSYLQYSQA